jgi:hypothetical protein
MLSKPNQATSHAAQQRLPEFLQTDLSVAANNFSLYNEYWIARSTYSFGKSGEQLRRNEFIPLTHPRLMRNAFRLHSVSGEPIPGDYVYKRDPMDERAQARFNESSWITCRSQTSRRPNSTVM